MKFIVRKSAGVKQILLLDVCMPGHKKLLCCIRDSYVHFYLVELAHIFCKRYTTAEKCGENKYMYAQQNHIHKVHCKGKTGTKRMYKMYITNGKICVQQITTCSHNNYKKKVTKKKHDYYPINIANTVQVKGDQTKNTIEPKITTHFSHSV
jgi:hypothetical protein